MFIEELNRIFWFHKLVCYELGARQISQPIPAHDFFLEVQIDEGELNTTEKLVLLQRVVSPDCDLQGLQSNRLDRHSVFEGFHEAGKTTFLYHFSFPLCNLRPVGNEISFHICTRLLSTGRRRKRSCVMNLEN